MEFGIWAYPWDLLDEGVESVADRLASMGITEINLATNYHTVQTFDPHNPKRKTFFARANSYFHPDDRYDELEPVPNPQMGKTDWIAEIREQLEGSQLDVNSWTIGCHNSELGMQNRDKTLRTPFGDPLVFGLCPSHPEVREYLLNLVGDLSDRGSFKGLQLETFHYFYGTGWSWHHDKFHVDLGILGEFLWGLCFCDDCRRIAADAGVDVEVARETCQDTIMKIVEGEREPTDDVTGWVESHPEVETYIDVRTETLAELYEDLDSTVNEELGCYVGMRGVDRSWMHGLDLDRLSESLDYYTVMAYKPTAKAAVADYEQTRNLSSGTPVHAGLLPAHPIVDEKETVVEQVDRLVEVGVDQISFYNYGLLPERNLDWVEAAMSDHV